MSKTAHGYDHRDIMAAMIIERDKAITGLLKQYGADDIGEFNAALTYAEGVIKTTPKDMANRFDVYEDVLESHRGLVRRLDVLINGTEGAAIQASLCDLVCQLASLIILTKEDTEEVEKLALRQNRDPRKVVSAAVRCYRSARRLKNERKNK